MASTTTRAASSSAAHGRSWSRAALERLWDTHLVGAANGIALDIHTGLGPFGRLTVFQTADAQEPAAELGATWYPSWLYRSDRTGSVDHGLLGPGFDEWAAAAPGRPAVATFVLEFGTREPTEGVTVFRADNWLHHHGDPTRLSSGTRSDARCASSSSPTTRRGAPTSPTRAWPPSTPPWTPSNEAITADRPPPDLPTRLTRCGASSSLPLRTAHPPSRMGHDQSSPRRHPKET